MFLRADMPGGEHTIRGSAVTPEVSDEGSVFSLLADGERTVVRKASGLGCKACLGLALRLTNSSSPCS
jgi:hypothetical protein